MHEISAMQQEGVRCIGNVWVSYEMHATWQDCPQAICWVVLLIVGLW